MSQKSETISVCDFNDKYIIKLADKEDSSFIGETVMKAVGDEICINLVNGRKNLWKAAKLFTELASQEDSQYSYKNTIIAKNEAGMPVGALISYDGANLYELRKAFIKKANQILGWNVTFEEADNWEAETNPDEIYIDSLYVKPEFRNQGIATELINFAFEKFASTGKPFGILVEPHNNMAFNLYKKLGFREDGINSFAGVSMVHLKHKSVIKRHSL